MSQSEHTCFSRFVFLASAVDGGTDRWRVLPSLVVLGLPLPLPRLSRRDRLKLGLALCSCYARARDLRSPNNVQVAAFPTEYCSIVIIASISIMSYQDLRKSQSTISRSQHYRCTPKGGHRRWFSNNWGSRTMGPSCAQQKTVRGPRVLHRSGLRLPCRSRGTVAGWSLLSITPIAG